MTEKEALRELNKCIGECVYRGCYGTAIHMGIVALNEVQLYREIGTVEECQKAIEKTNRKKPRSINKVGEDTIYMMCGNCSLTTVLYSGMEPDYCPKCGQAIDWS